MKSFLKIALNSSAVLLLFALVVAPIYFAKNFAKVEGVKTESKFLVVSQIDKFPNLSLSQTNKSYNITFAEDKYPQAFLGVLVINNPTQNAQTYKIENYDTEAIAFFGQDIENQTSQIALSPQTSIPVSIFSSNQSASSTQTVEFQIKAQ